MKKTKLFLFFGAALLCILTISCARSELTPESAQRSEKRSVTITNNTGNILKSYQLNAGVDGIEIDKGTFTDRSITVEISENWENHSNIEIILIDVYDHTYKKFIFVSLTGTTNVSLDKNDLVDEGIKTRLRNLFEAMNENK